MEENQSFPKKNRLQALAFLKVGLVEFFFVAIVLFLFFGILNYFNILPVSDTFPKYLSWLPKQTKTVPQGVALQTQNNPTNPPATIEPFEKVAQQLFYTFVSQNLDSSIRAFNNTYPVTPITFEKDAFDYKWTTENGTVSAHFKLATDYKNFSYLTLGIVIPQNTIPSAEFSAKIANQFLSISPQGIWKCKTVNKLISCENFWADQDGVKRGVDVAGPIILNNNEKAVVLSFCEFHKDSPLYQSTSCTP